MQKSKNAEQIKMNAAKVTIIIKAICATKVAIFQHKANLRTTPLYNQRQGILPDFIANQSSLTILASSQFRKC